MRNEMAVFAIKGLQIFLVVVIIVGMLTELNFSFSTLSDETGDLCLYFDYHMVLIVFALVLAAWICLTKYKLINYWGRFGISVALVIAFISSTANTILLTSRADKSCQRERSEILMEGNATDRNNMLFKQQD